MNVVSVDPMVHLENVVCQVQMDDLVLQVLEDLQGLKVNAALQVLMVLLDYRENEDYRGHLEQKENKDNLAYLDHQGLLEDRDLQVYRVNAARKDLRVNVDCPDHEEQMDLREKEDHVDHLDPLELRAKLACQDHKDDQGKGGQLVKEETQACLEHQESQELPDHRDRKGLVADLVSLVQQVKRVKLVRKEQPGYAASLDALANPGFLVLQDLEVNKAHVDQQEALGQQALVDLVEKWVKGVHPVARERLDYVANKVKGDHLDKPELQVNKGLKDLLGQLDHLALLDRKAKEEKEENRASLVKKDYQDLKGHEVGQVQMDCQVALEQQGQWVFQAKGVSLGVLVRWGRVVNQARWAELAYLDDLVNKD